MYNLSLLLAYIVTQPDRPTHTLRRLRRKVGRSVGLADSRIEPQPARRGSVGRSIRPKICFAALRAAGRSVGLCNNVG